MYSVKVNIKVMTMKIFVYIPISWKLLSTEWGIGPSRQGKHTHIGSFQGTVHSLKPNLSSYTTLERDSLVPIIGLRLASRVTKRTFISLRTKPLHLPPIDPTFAIPSHAVVDEERCPDYTPQDYYTARPGETLGNNYQLLAKIGWGMSSTVWLARDIRREITIDLKLANILMTFENEKAIPRFIQEQVLKSPMHHKSNPVTNHTTYQSYNGFGRMDVKDVGNVLPKITDFGSAWLFVVDPETKSQNQPVITYPIQPNYYRAPEVVLGYGWDCSADIWNFGVLVWNIIEGTELFTQVEDANGRYDPKSHLAEMIALLGPPPKEVGKSCKNAREVFGGPYFDEEGKFLHQELVPNRKLEDTIQSIDDSEREIFLSFARDMLTWVPSERKTARELTEHPFLNFGGHVPKDVLEGRS
ncbi:hypothetical protein N7501_010576 [Penicillium viridicatum]|nr:hypothetical protein N7501_010576 [Penicillium viridicatum]